MVLGGRVEKNVKVVCVYQLFFVPLQQILVRSVNIGESRLISGRDVYSNSRKYWSR